MTSIAADAAAAGYATNAVIQSWAPEPRVSAAEKTIFDLVKADLDERDRIGAAQYGGRALLASAKKDWLAELYAELLDAAVYIRGLLEQRKAE